MVYPSLPLRSQALLNACIYCRKWIWIGIGYNVGMSFVMTYLMGVFLTFLNPPRAQLTTPADEVALRSKINRDAVERSRTQRRLKVDVTQSHVHGFDSPVISL